MLRLLDRVVLAETARLTFFFASTYLALISAVIVAPLIDAGARLSDVLLLLPVQLGFPATIVVPLAFITALLAACGRMRQDGEVVALQAAGISPGRVPWGLWPLVLILTLVVGWLAHTSMPRAYRAYREAKASLLRQAIATKVAREEPVVSQRNLQMTALDAADNELTDLFAWVRDDRGTVMVTYAPRASWVAGGDDAALRLQLEQTRQLRVSYQAGRLQPAMASMDFPRLVIDLPDESESFLQKPEGKSTPALLADLPRLQGLHERTTAASNRTELIQALVAGAPERLQQWHVASWPVLLRLLRSPDTPLPALLPDELPEPRDADGQQNLLLAVSGIAGALLHDAALTRTPNLPAPALAQLRQQSSRAAGMLVLWDLLSPALHFDGGNWAAMAALRDYGWQNHKPFKEAHASVLNQVNREWRGNQMAWHLRLVLSVTILSLWCFGAGLGLTMSPQNRLLAAGIGIVVLLIALLPGIAVVKGMRGNLRLHPGWILWSPQILLAGLGIWLWSRQRR